MDEENSDIKKAAKHFYLVFTNILRIKLLQSIHKVPVIDASTKEFIHSNVLKYSGKRLSFL